jgi:FixJ family two-component response regulator
MIWQREVLGLTNRAVAANLGVDSVTVTVWRTVKLFRETGDI